MDVIARPPSPMPIQDLRQHRFVPALPTLDPGLLLSRAQTLSEFPMVGLGAPGRQLFYLARAGIFHSVSHLVGPSGGTVLMPAYHHGVEVEAVRATGARVLFYRVDGDMRLDLDDLAIKMRLPDIRLVYLTHYVGFAQPVAEVKRLCVEANLPLFEDCALAFLARDPDGRPVGSTGDAAVFCIYKSLPVPHGGLLVSTSMPMVHLRRPPLSSTIHHMSGSLLSHVELVGGRMGAGVRALARVAAHATIDTLIDSVSTGTSHLRADELSLGASALVSVLLARIDLPAVARRRRRNYLRLAEQLRGVVPIIGDPLPPGACPLSLPVRVKDKQRVLSILRARGIEAIDFWANHDAACPAEVVPEVMTLRREVLELPIHQSLDEDAIDFVAASTLAAVAHA